MNKFEVGDRVKVLNALVDTHLIGKIVKITEIVDGYIYVKGGTNGWSMRNLEGFLIKVDKKGHPAKEEKVMFIATYDVNDVDPHKTFTSSKELSDWLKEAKDDSSIKFSSIKVYEVKKELRVITSFRLK